MAPKFVAPYRMSGKRGKNDAADAQAICEAVQRPNMRFACRSRARASRHACACTACAKARNKDDQLSRRARALEVRRGCWRAVVAIAAKNARMAWAVLVKGENFKPLEA